MEEGGATAPVPVPVPSATEAAVLRHVRAATAPMSAREVGVLIWGADDHGFLMQGILDALVRRGQLHRHADGRVEAAGATAGNTPPSKSLPTRAEPPAPPPPPPSAAEVCVLVDADNAFDVVGKLVSAFREDPRARRESIGAVDVVLYCSPAFNGKLPSAAAAPDDDGGWCSVVEKRIHNTAPNAVGVVMILDVAALASRAEYRRVVVVSRDELLSVVPWAVGADAAAFPHADRVAWFSGTRVDDVLAALRRPDGDGDGDGAHAAMPSITFSAASVLV